MIFDKLSNTGLYFSERFNEVFEQMYLRIKEDQPGEYPIIENEVFIKILHYSTKQSDFIIESHISYIDLQVVYFGAEAISIYDKDKIQITKPYSQDTDCQFYIVNKADPEATLYLLPGNFAIFFPDDIHMTQMAVNDQPMLIKKAVIKIHEKFYTSAREA